MEHIAYGDKLVAEAGMGTSVFEDVRLSEPEFWMAQPHDIWARLRAEEPVYWSEQDGAWVVTKYDEIRQMSRSPRLFGNRYGFVSDMARLRDDSEGFLVSGEPMRPAEELPGDMPRGAELRRDQSQAPFGADHLVISDPPRHSFLRKLMSGAFTPRALAKLEETVHGLTIELFDSFSVGDEVNLVEAIAAPIPTTVIAEMLGVPPSDHALFTEWTDGFLEAANAPLVVDLTDALRWQQAFIDFRAYFTAALEERRVAPRGDLLTAMVQVDDDGDPVLTLNDQIAMAMVLVGAGNETSRGLIAGAANTLWEQQDQRRKLIENPQLLESTAIEELVRYQTPVTQMCRTALEDTELRGKSIAKGDYLVMAYQSANRDEDVWDRAERLEVDRPSDPLHLAFGYAEHFCLGANLARRSSRFVLGELLTRFPNYEVVGDVEWYRSVITPNPRVVPVLLK